MERIRTNNVQQGRKEFIIHIEGRVHVSITCSDTALNLAVHRLKYPIVDLLLQYRANPNLYNQSGKTALHRAAVSYPSEGLQHLQTLLNVSFDVLFKNREYCE